MRVTLDTNVLFQALHSKRGASFAILNRVRHGNLEPALSVPVFKEYEDVLTRRTSLSTFGLTIHEVRKILDFIVMVAFPVDIHFSMRPNLRDEDDNKCVDLAFASQSRFLVTQNVRDFKAPELKFDSFSVITPSDFVDTKQVRA